MDPRVAAELAPYTGRLVGQLPPEVIRRVDIPRPEAAVVAGFRALPDLTSVVADILDGFGYDTAVPAGLLAPLAPGQRVVGPALTVRQGRVRHVAGHGLANRLPTRLGGIDQITLSRPGDVLVIDAGGASGASSFGGLMAVAVREHALAGVVIDGHARDGENLRRDGLALWSRGLTPRTGKHRLEVVEFNGTVEIGGVQVRPGDLILGDSDGIVVVPPEIAAAVLERATAAAEREGRLVEALRGGASPGDSVAILPPDQW